MFHALSVLLLIYLYFVNPTHYFNFVLVLQVPEVVDQVLQHVHHVRRNVVEGDGVVTQSTEALLLTRTMMSVLVGLLSPPRSTCTSGTSQGSNLQNVR